MYETTDWLIEHDGRVWSGPWASRDKAVDIVVNEIHPKVDGAFFIVSMGGGREQIGRLRERQIGRAA